MGTNLSTSVSETGSGVDQWVITFIYVCVIMSESRIFHWYEGIQIRDGGRNLKKTQSSETELPEFLIFVFVSRSENQYVLVEVISLISRHHHLKVKCWNAHKFTKRVLN